MNCVQDDVSIPYLSIVVPAYNEERRIADSLQTMAEYLEDRDYSYEVIISDDGSTDGTVDIVHAFIASHPHFRLNHCPVNHGKGYAVRTGIMSARGKFILFCDADLATPMEELEGFWPHLQDGADIVIASRPIHGSHLVKHQPLYREAAGRIFNHIVRMLAVRDIHDTQCGFKLFTHEAAHTIFSQCTLNGFSFDIEVLHIAQQLGFTIVEAPVHWYHRAGSKVSFLRDGTRMLTDLLKIRMQHRTLKKYER